MPNSPLLDLAAASDITGDELLYAVQDGSDKKVSQRSLISFLRAADGENFIGTTLDCNSENGVVYTDHLCGSTVTDGWSGRIRGFNRAPSETGTPSIIDGHFAAPYEQEEHHWYSGNSLSVTVHVLSGTANSSGTSITFSNAILNGPNAVGELSVGDLIKSGVQYRAIVSIDTDGSYTKAVLNKAFTPDLAGATVYTGGYALCQTGGGGGYLLNGSVTGTAGSFTVTTTIDLTDYFCPGSRLYVGTDSATYPNELKTVAAIDAGSITFTKALVSNVTAKYVITGGIRTVEKHWNPTPGNRTYFFFATPQFPNDQGGIFNGIMTYTVALANSYGADGRIVEYTGYRPSPNGSVAIYRNNDPTAPIVGINLVGEAGAVSLNWKILANGAGNSAATSAVRNLFFINVPDNDYLLGMWRDPKGTFKGRIGIGIFTEPTCKLDVDGAIRTRIMTYAQLIAIHTAAQAGKGTRAYISDGSTAVYRAICIGGGGNEVPLISDGTDWRVS